MNHFILLFVRSYMAVILLVIAIGVGVTIWALKKKRGKWAVVFFAIATLPITTYQIRMAVAKNTLENRLAEISAFPRQTLPYDYPRILIVDGFYKGDKLGELLVLGHFDEVLFLQSRRG